MVRSPGRCTDSNSPSVIDAYTFHGQFFSLMRRVYRYADVLSIRDDWMEKSSIRSQPYMTPPISTPSRPGLDRPFGNPAGSRRVQRPAKAGDELLQGGLLPDDVEYLSARTGLPQHPRYRVNQIINIYAGESGVTPVDQHTAGTDASELAFIVKHVPYVG